MKNNVIQTELARIEVQAKVDFVEKFPIVLFCYLL